jgi:hypothetical protein
MRKTYEELERENTELRELLNIEMGQCNYCGAENVEVMTDFTSGRMCIDRETCQQRIKERFTQRG